MAVQLPHLSYVLGKLQKCHPRGRSVLEERTEITLYRWMTKKGTCCEPLRWLCRGGVSEPGPFRCVWGQGWLGGDS